MHKISLLSYAANIIYIYISCSPNLLLHKLYSKVKALNLLEVVLHHPKIYSDIQMIIIVWNHRLVMIIVELAV